MNTITPNLWFDGNAVEAAEFYVSIFHDSRIDKIVMAPADTPGPGKGDVLVVEFTLLGRPFAGINGGPDFSFTEAVSFAIECRDQEEVDHYWNRLISGGGSEGPCGWCRDRFGLSWQVIPGRLNEMMESPDREAAERAMKAMLSMGKIEIKALEEAFGKR